MTQHSRLEQRAPAHVVALRLATIGLLVGTALACGGSEVAKTAVSESGAMLASGTATTDPDERTALMLPAQGRHLVLVEMRTMLTSVQEFVAAAAIGDTAAMRAAATASGVAAARDLDPAMQQRLPQEFLRLGMNTHAAWDSLAMDVSSGMGTRAVPRPTGRHHEQLCGLSPAVPDQSRAVDATPNARV